MVCLPFFSAICKTGRALRLQLLNSVKFTLIFTSKTDIMIV